ncbi:MAG: T9SS type A sorting domain-containing protein [Bacteroidales bacterium]|nr:T9SS type A sorting domain-containing protein [Bacteroidales bacterium]
MERKINDLAVTRTLGSKYNPEEAVSLTEQFPEFIVIYMQLFIFLMVYSLNMSINWFYMQMLVLALLFPLSGSAQNGSFIKNDSLSKQIIDLAQGKVLWGDYDADGDADIFIIGESGHKTGGYFYRNDGEAGFMEIDPLFPELMFSDAVWNDHDRDGDLDLFITGAVQQDDSLIPQGLYFRNENGNFIEIQTNIPGVYDGCAAFADFDRDGDQDLLLSGATGSDDNGSLIHTYCRLYVNEGSDIFSEIQAGIKGVYNGNISIADYDNNMYPDVLITGELYDDGGSWHRTSYLYRNNGDNSFSMIETGLPPLSGGDAVFGDYDNDGLTDILLNGSPPTPTNLVYLFRNNGDGSFYDVGIEIIGTVDGSVDWADYDNDGDLDFLITGLQFESSEYPVSQIYKNAGSNMFSSDQTIILDGLMHSSVSWGDIDNDKDLDLIMMGYADIDGTKENSFVYTNTTSPANSIPLSPAGLSHEILGNDVILQWENGFDPETPADGLTYNLRMGSMPGGMDIISPIADDDGLRQVFGAGNIFQCHATIISGLEPGNYYWSVQSLDHCFIGSPFSEEKDFTITATEISNLEPEIITFLSIYPIPSKDFINLDISSQEESSCSILISTSTGIILKEYSNLHLSPGINKLKVDLNGLTAGLLFVHLIADRQEIMSRKFIIPGN